MLTQEPNSACAEDFHSSLHTPQTSSEKSMEVCIIQQYFVIRVYLLSKRLNDSVREWVTHSATG